VLSFSRDCDEEIQTSLELAFEELDDGEARLRILLTPFMDSLTVSENGKERPSKRRKTGSGAETVDNQKLYDHYLATLTGAPRDLAAGGLLGLHNSIVEHYRAMDDGQRRSLLGTFGRIPCAGSRCLDTSKVDFGLWGDYPCRICDEPQKKGQRDPETYWNGHTETKDENWKDVIAALLVITELEEFQKSRKPRIMMALTIKRVFNHISDAGYLDLANCSLGQWCLAMLSRSCRELRIAAG